MARRLLVGATVSSTDAAAVFSAIRGLNIRRRLAAILEAESGLNDPFAALLVIGLVDWQDDPGLRAGRRALLLVEQVGIGAIGGIAIGFATVWLLRRLPLLSAGIAPVVTIVRRARRIRRRLGARGSGLLAAYLAGLIIGDARIPHSAVVRGFLQGGAWLAQLGAVRAAGAARHPARPGARGPRAAGDRARAGADRPAARRGRYAPRRSACPSGTGLPGLGRPTRRRADRLCDVPDRGGAVGQRADLRRRLLRGVRLGACCKG